MNKKLESILNDIFVTLISDFAKIGAINAQYLIERAKINKKIKSEVEKISKYSGIFDTDAMCQYLENMRPVQQIYNSVISGNKNIEEIVNKQARENVNYMKNKNISISVSEEKEIISFYTRIKDICCELLHFSLSSGEKSLLYLMRQDMQSNQNTILNKVVSKEDIAKVENRIEEKVNNFINEINPMGEKINGLKKYYTKNNAILYNTAPAKIEGGSEKEQFVKKVLELIRKCDWVHVFGKMYVGKTQALIRVTEKIFDFVWINVNEEDFIYIDVNELELSESSILIMDGIPNIANTQILEKCISIFEDCKQKKCKLLTCGYENIEDYVKNYNIEVCSIELKGFDEKEVKEITRHYVTDTDIFKTVAYSNFVDICKDIPPVVMAVILYLKENNWKFDDKIILSIINKKTDSIEERTKAAFLSCISDETIRRLYYRILYVGKRVDKNLIPYIASVENKIIDYDVKLQKLKNKWMYIENDNYCSSNLLAGFAEEQLKEYEKKELNEIVINFLRNKTLDPIDISSLFLCYSRLEKYDEQGLLCVDILNNMIENNITNFYIKYENFWIYSKLPENMSTDIKCLVRITQLYYKIWCNEIDDMDYKLRMDEIKIYNNSKFINILIPLFGMKISEFNMKSSINFFTEYIDIYDDSPSSNDILPDEYNSIKILETFDKLILIKIDTVEYLYMYIAAIKDKISRIGYIIENTEDIYMVIQYMVGKIYEKTEEKNKLDVILQKVFDWIKVDEYPVLWGCVFNAYLYFLQLQKSYEFIKELYYTNEYIIKQNPEKYCPIIDQMARIAHDNNDFELEKFFFRWEMDIIPKITLHSDFVMIDSCLIYLDSLETKDFNEIQRVYRNMQIIGNEIESKEKNKLLSKNIEAEYWMKMHSLDLLEDNIGEFLIFIKSLIQYFDEQGGDSIKCILVRILHVLWYIYSETFRDKAPDKFPDGEIYAKPALRMFLNDVTEDKILEYWVDEKREAVCLVAGMLADYYNLSDMGNEFFQLMTVKTDFWSEMLENMYRTHSYLQFKLLDSGEYDKFFYVITKEYKRGRKGESVLNSEYILIVIELFIISLYICEIYNENRNKAIDFCEEVILRIHEEMFDNLALQYYLEYKKVLSIIVEEDADFDLLHEAFMRVKTNSNLKNMDSSIFPLLSLEASQEEKLSIKNNIVKVVKNLGPSDFVIYKKIAIFQKNIELNKAK